MICFKNVSVFTFELLLTFFTCISLFVSFIRSFCVFNIKQVIKNFPTIHMLKCKHKIWDPGSKIFKKTLFVHRWYTTISCNLSHLDRFLCQHFLKNDVKPFSSCLFATLKFIFRTLPINSLLILIGIINECRINNETQFSSYFCFEQYFFLNNKPFYSINYR